MRDLGNLLRGGRGELEYVSWLEDEQVVWFARTASRWEVRCHLAREWSLGLWWIVVASDHMRAATTADCPATVHATDDPDRRDRRSADCRCFEIEDDGYFLDCEPGHPDAIELWRCEPGHPPLWLVRLRYWQQRLGARRRRRPVLWGGRVEREATWLDRVLFGGGCGWLLHGDRYHSVGESELRHCVTCGHATPHRPRYGGEMVCNGPLHFTLSFEGRYPVAGVGDRR